MNKAFTLVELLGVIVILSIIALIVTPLISSLISNSKENLNNAQVESVKRAAKNFVSENLYTLNKKCDTYTKKEENYTCTISLKTLQNSGFLEENTIKNIKSDSAYDESTNITVTYKNGKFTYTFPTS